MDFFNHRERSMFYISFSSFLLYRNCKRLRQCELVKKQKSQGKAVEVTVNNKTLVWISSKNSTSGQSTGTNFFLVFGRELCNLLEETSRAGGDQVKKYYEPSMLQISGTQKIRTSISSLMRPSRSTTQVQSKRIEQEFKRGRHCIPVLKEWLIYGELLLVVVYTIIHARQG